MANPRRPCRRGPSAPGGMAALVIIKPMHAVFPRRGFAEPFPSLRCGIGPVYPPGTANPRRPCRRGPSAPGGMAALVIIKPMHAVFPRRGFAEPFPSLRCGIGPVYPPGTANPRRPCRRGPSAPGGIRTHGLPLRRRPLYPAELRVHAHIPTPVYYGTNRCGCQGRKCFVFSFFNLNKDML